MLASQYRLKHYHQIFHYCSPNLRLSRPYQFLPSSISLNSSSFLYVSSCCHHHHQHQRLSSLSIPITRIINILPLLLHVIGISSLSVYVDITTLRFRYQSFFPNFLVILRFFVFVFLSDIRSSFLKLHYVYDR